MLENIKIVIAEDMEPILLYLEKVISQAPEIEVVGKAQNGYELIESVKKHMPDVVVTDIEMPKCSGINAIEELDKHGINSKYIVMTGNSSYIVTDKLRNMGVLQVITKPILDDKKLIEQIKAVASFKIQNQEEKTEDKLEIDKDNVNDKIIKYKKENIFTKIINRVFGKK